MPAFGSMQEVSRSECACRLPHFSSAHTHDPAPASSCPLHLERCLFLAGPAPGGGIERHGGRHNVGAHAMQLSGNAASKP